MTTGYAAGEGVEAPDLGEALLWYERAAESGDPQALFHLGQRYGNGAGVEQGALANVFKLYSDVPFFWDAWDTMPYHLETGKALNDGSGALLARALGAGVEERRRRVLLRRAPAEDQARSVASWNVFISVGCCWPSFRRRRWGWTASSTSSASST